MIILLRQKGALLVTIFDAGCMDSSFSIFAVASEFVGQVRAAIVSISIRVAAGSQSCRAVTTLLVNVE